MVRAEEAYDEWYDDDPAPEAHSEAFDARPLGLVRPPKFAFQLIKPESYEVAQTIADRLREGAPVVIDFRGCEPRLVGRLTDFGSGLAYALGGSLQFVGTEVMLLTPDHIDVSGDEASGVRSPGFFNRR
jgi:cell division inhibitor SepF